MSAALAWDDASGIRERLALLAALASTVQGVPAESWLADVLPRYTYDPSADRWTYSGERGYLGPWRVAIGAGASVQLDRLRKRGIGYHDAIRLIGYGHEQEQSE